MPATCSANWRLMTGRRISSEALAQRERAQFEYEAAVDLQARDLQSDVVVAQLKAALESAEAAVTRAQLASIALRSLPLSTAWSSNAASRSEIF